jgi:fructose-1,6-bisphosphatase II
MYYSPNIVYKVCAAGARLKPNFDEDVAGALTAAMEDYSGVDMLMGIGGSPEAVLAACALKCLGGEIQCRVWPGSEEEKWIEAVHHWTRLTDIDSTTYDPQI